MDRHLASCALSDFRATSLSTTLFPFSGPSAFGGQLGPSSCRREQQTEVVEGKNSGRERVKRICLLYIVCASLAGVARGQVAPGYPNFSGYDSHEVDTVNLMNNNIILGLPIRSTAGVPPLNLRVDANSYVYTIGSSPAQWVAPMSAQSGASYAPFYNSFNGANGSGITFALYTTGVSWTCAGINTTKYSGWYVYMQNGTFHYLPSTFYTTAASGSLPCMQSATAVTADGSGITVSITGSNVNSIVMPDGTSIGTTSGVNLGWLTDPHGNVVKYDGYGFHDAAGQLQVATSIAQNAYDVPDPNAWGSTVRTQQNTATKTVQTAFACTSPSITDIPGTSGKFTTGFSFPEGSSVGFTYEPTPGVPANITGRIKTITLREGGQITYTYGGSNHGIDCVHQNVPVLTRTLSNGEVTTYTLGYTIIGTGPSYRAINEVVDNGGNHTKYQFTGFTSSGNAGAPTAQVITKITRYQGASTTTPLLTEVYCYNLAFSSCSTSTAPDASVPSPILSQIVFRQIGTRTDWSAVEQHFDQYGNVTYVAEYDFNQSSPTRATTIRYGSCTAGCNSLTPTVDNTAMAAYGIINKPGSVITAYGANTTAASNFVYSSKGDVLTSYVWSGSTWLSNATVNAYNANGTPTDIYSSSGQHTQYKYDPSKYQTCILPTGGQDYNCALAQFAFPSQVQDVGTGMHQDFDYTGENNTAEYTLDSNGNETSVGWNDPLWRPRSIQDPMGDQEGFYYTPTSFQHDLYYGTADEQRVSTADAFGRTIATQQLQMVGGSNYDTASVAYGWSGNYATIATSQPCTATLAGTCSTVHTASLDPLGRLITQVTTSRETVIHTYVKNDDLIQLTPPPTGENMKQVQNEYDGLYRLTKTCMIGNGSSTACNQASGSANGVSDVYTYSNGSGYTQVQIVRAGTQTRTFKYDALGRLIYKSTPEGGAWNYYYDTSVSGCTSSGNFPGKLTCVKDPNNNEIVYLYDGLGRITDVGAGPWGTNSACKRFRYDNTNGVLGARPTGVTLANQYSRLSEAATDDCVHYGTAVLTDEWFAYDKGGRQTDIWESTPHSTQYYHSVATFFGNGVPQAVQLASPSLYTMTYTLDGEGRWNSLTDTTTSQTLVSGATFYPAANPAVISLTGTTPDNDSYSFDANTGKITQHVFSVGNTPKTLTGALTWNPSGTLAKLTTTDGFNAGGTLTCLSNSASALGYGYDDLNRLREFDCGSGNWGQEFTYDAYDNLTKAVISGRTGTTWNPTYTSSNHYNCGASCTYDSNGNVTGDSNNTFQWSEFNKLKSSASSGTPTCGTSGKCTTYDAFGRMVETSSNSTWREYWWTQAGTVQMAGASPQFANWSSPEGGTAEVNGNSVSYIYLHKDWLGSARLASNLVSNAYTADQAYTPYGEVFANFGSNSSAYDLFAGITANFNNGVTYDTSNRELSIVGRFLSPDPANSGWNQYAYPTNPNSFNDPSGLCSEITAGIGQGPNTVSGKALTLIAQLFGANLVFPYAGQSMVQSVLDIGFQAFGSNKAATNVASLAFQMTQWGAAQNGTQFLAVGFSGGAQANVSASGRTHLPASTFADPGLGLGAFLPKDSTVYLGSGLTSDLVNFTSPGGETNTGVPGCGHDLACIIANSPDLQKALADAGPCQNPLVFSRTNNGGVAVSGQGNGGAGGGGGGNGGIPGTPGAGPAPLGVGLNPIEVVTSTCCKIIHE